MSYWDQVTRLHRHPWLLYAQFFFLKKVIIHTKIQGHNYNHNGISPNLASQSSIKEVYLLTKKPIKTMIFCQNQANSKISFD